MTRYLVAVGGGELKEKTTRPIDSYCAALAKLRAGERRATAVFLGTASHDSLPYFNTFRKTYTSDCDMKSDVVLLTKKDVAFEKNVGKLQSADLIYVGGGDTLYMLEVWRQTGILPHILAAYERGVIIAGLSAGAICWFGGMYTDADIMRGGADYSLFKGLGLLEGTMCPHYDQRPEFDDVINKIGGIGYAAENNSAIVFKDGALAGALSAGGKSYFWDSGKRAEIPLIPTL